MFKPQPPTEDGYYWQKDSENDDYPLPCQVMVEDEVWVRWFGDTAWTQAKEEWLWEGPIQPEEE